MHRCEGYTVAVADCPLSWCVRVPRSSLAALVMYDVMVRRNGDVTKLDAAGFVERFGQSSAPKSVSGEQSLFFYFPAENFNEVMTMCVAAATSAGQTPEDAFSYCKTITS